MEAKKEPTISKEGQKTFFENHTDAEHTFKAEDLHMSDSYFIRKANNSKFIFQGKVKNIFLEGCKGVELTCMVLCFMNIECNSNGRSG